MFPLGSAAAPSSQFENNDFTEMCSGSETGSYLRLIDFVYHSILGFRVIQKKKRAPDCAPRGSQHLLVPSFSGNPKDYKVTLAKIRQSLAKIRQLSPSSPLACRCRAIWNKLSQSGSDSGLGFKVKQFKIFNLSPFRPGAEGRAAALSRTVLPGLGR